MAGAEDLIALSRRLGKLQTACTDARTRAVTATKELARCSQENDVLRAKYEHQKKAVRSLKESLDAADRESKELSLANHHLSSELDQAQKQMELMDRQARISASAMRGSQDMVRSDWIKRSSRGQVVLQSLQTLVKSLRGAAPADGPEHTLVQRIASDMGRALQSLHQILEEPIVGDEAGALEDGQLELDVDGAVPAAPGAEGNNLIPQYRLAIVKARAQCAALREKAKEWKKEKQGLEDEVARWMAAAQESRTELERLQLDLYKRQQDFEKERATLLGDMATLTQRCSAGENLQDEIEKLREMCRGFEASLYQHQQERSDLEEYIRTLEATVERQRSDRALRKMIKKQQRDERRGEEAAAAAAPAPALAEGEHHDDRVVAKTFVRVLAPSAAESADATQVHVWDSGPTKQQVVVNGQPIQPPPGSKSASGNIEGELARLDKEILDLWHEYSTI